jgi:ATP-binding cassette subfamily F protein uup
MARRHHHRSVEEELQAEPPAKLVVENVSKSFGDNKVLRGVSLTVRRGEKLAVIGPNGLGKSTLLKIMLGQLEPTSGEVEIGARTEINYVDQNRLLLDDAKTVLEEVGEGMEYVRLGEENITLRGYLRRFLFTEERINTKIDQLSGGERSRVLLAKILKRGGNVLMLDEPTNDLDLGTLRLLEEALVAFTGSVIVVSHDRYFLNRVCTAILAFEDDGAVRYSVGNYDYYLEKRAQEVTNIIAAPDRPKASPSTAPKPRKLKYGEQRELEGMEAAILTAEENVSRLEALLNNSDFFTTRAVDFPEVEAELRAARAEVARLYARWEELGQIATAG